MDVIFSLNNGIFSPEEALAPTPTSRKSLAFSSPAVKKNVEATTKSQPKAKPTTHANSLDDSGLEPLEDSISEDDKAKKGKKRPNDQMFGSMSDSEEEDWFKDDNLPSIGIPYCLFNSTFVLGSFNCTTYNVVPIYTAYTCYPLMIIKF